MAKSLLRNPQGVVDIDAKVADSADQLSMP
jgi:hypothetical protein